MKHTLLGNEISVLTDYHANGSYEILNKKVNLGDEVNFAYMVRTTDFIKEDHEKDIKYVSQEAYDFLSKTKLYGNELIINKIGNPGQVFLMPELSKPSTLGMNLFMARMKSNSILNNYYLYIFFNTTLGRNIILREVNGTVPLTIDKQSIKNLIIPIIPQSTQTKVKELIKTSYSKTKESKIIYKEAEEILLKELDLLDFIPSNKNISIKSFKESFEKTGRLDSEYYQPQYDEILGKMIPYRTQKLGELVDIKKSIEPGSKHYKSEGIPFIRVANLSKFGISETDIYLSKDLLSSKNLEQLYPSKDTILLSKDGSVGIAYKVKEDLKVVTSGALLHLSLKNTEVLLEYLTLVLNSQIVQSQAERDAGGSIIQHWKPSEIASVIIPILNHDIQIQIEEKIQKSFELREQSKQILEEAKLMVERAIETGAF